MARLQSSVAFNYGGNGIIQFYGMDQKRAQIDVWTKEEDDIFAKYSLFAHFSLEKHATQNFYVFKLEKHPKVS